MRQNLKYLVVLLCCLMLALAVQVLTPEPLDWSMSFSRHDRIPFGSLIVFEVLPQILPSRRLAVAQMPVYNTLANASARRDSMRANYLFINHVFAPDELDARALLRFVAEGNSVFVAANIFGGALADTLKLKTDTHFIWEDSLGLNFDHAQLRAPNDYYYARQTVNYYFSNFDTARTTLLGRDSRGGTNFIRLRFGQGDFLLHAFPFAFTNYYMLFRDNHEYAARALSCLPVRDTFWDEYYKTGKAQIRTPLRYVLSQEPLRWAYYLSVAGMLLFVVFQGKRRQRVIPLRATKTNTSLEFVETVGRLYFQTGDHKKLAHKKIAFFLEYLRSRFYLNTDNRDEEFVRRVAEKSGIAVEALRATFVQIQNLQAQPRVSEADLLGLNRALENFYHKTGA